MTPFFGNSIYNTGTAKILPRILIYLWRNESTFQTQTNRSLTPPSRVLMYASLHYAAVWSASFERGFKETMFAAIAEGEQSVEETMAAGAIYIEKAKSIAGNALSTAQVRLYRYRSFLLV
jgi:hypothetical protein